MGGGSICLPEGIIFFGPAHDGNGSGRNVDPECANGEESENGFGEHDDGECRKREQITTAPGLRLEKGIGESCTAAEETRERTSNLLYVRV